MAENQSMSSLRSFDIDHGSGLPVWIQIKNRIAFLIRSGEYQPGDQLPTVRALALALDISYNTVNRSYIDLEREGFLVTRRGRGTFVSEQAPSNHSATEREVSLLAVEMVRIAREGGLSDNDIIQTVQNHLLRG